MLGAPEKSTDASAGLQRLPMALALPILIHAETSACPAVGQLVNRIDDLFGKGSDLLPDSRPSRIRKQETRNNSDATTA